MQDLDDITGTIVDAAMQLHRDLGPGLLESVYEAILARELERRGLRTERQKVIRFEYQGMVFDDGFRVDLLVEDRVIVEIKSVEQIARAHAKQLLTYLKLSDTRVGLLINFGAPRLRDGLRRVVNEYSPSAASRLRVNQGVARLRANQSVARLRVNQGVARLRVNQSAFNSPHLRVNQGLSETPT